MEREKQILGRETCWCNELNHECIPCKTAREWKALSEDQKLLILEFEYLIKHEGPRSKNAIPILKEMMRQGIDDYCSPSENISI